MKTIIEQEDVGKEIGELGLMRIEYKLLHDPFRHIREHQRLQEEDNESILTSRLNDSNSSLLGTTHSGAECRVRNNKSKKETDKLLGEQIKKQLEATKKSNLDFLDSITLTPEDIKKAVKTKRPYKKRVKK
jgi:hypothetical protein